MISSFIGEATNMSDGCATSESKIGNRNDQGALVEDEPAHIRELEVRLAALEVRVETLEKMLSRQAW